MAWPAVASIGAVEIAMQLVRRSRGPRAATSVPAVPEVPGDVEQAVRAAYAASVAAGAPLSQRAMAERFGLSRRRVGQLVEACPAGHVVRGHRRVPDHHRRLAGRADAHDMTQPRMSGRERASGTARSHVISIR